MGYFPSSWFITIFCNFHVFPDGTLCRMFLLSCYVFPIEVRTLIVKTFGLDLCGILFISKTKCFTLVSFFCLVQTLTDILCNQLEKDELKLNSKVLSLSYRQGGNSASENWSVSRVADDDKHSQSLSVDALIMTVSLFIILRT